MSISADIFRRTGLIFLTSAFMGRHSQDLDRDSGLDNYIVYGHPDPQPQHPRKRRGFITLVGIFIVILVLTVTPVLVLTTLPRFPTESYVEVNGNIKVAEIRVDPISKLPNDMNVYLVLFDNDSYQNVICKVCTMQGDHVSIQGNLIKYPWLSFLGRHSGFKLTSLETYYQKSNSKSHYKSNFMVLNGGDDSLFVRLHGWPSLIIEAVHSNSVVIPEDGKTYNIFISQTGILYLRPAE